MILFIMNVDIHIHSNYSDSTLSIEEIAIKAIENNISLISICDHHSTQNYPELKVICKKYKLNYIYGLEINASLDNDDAFIHILAYNPNPKSVRLKQLLKDCVTEYDKMSDRLINYLARDIEKVTLRGYKEFIYTGKYGGWKSYEFLIELGIINQLQDYFRLLKFYKVEKPGFMSVEQVCSIIKDAGGIPVLAHPGNTFPEEKISNYLETICLMGIEGIECYYPKHNPKVIEICIEFCRNYNLLITGGSDDHGYFMKNDIHGFDGMHNYKINLKQLKLGSIKIY